MEQTASETTATNTNPSISVNDIAICKKIIEVANSRGAFKPDELTTVGNVYQKISAFIGWHAAQQQPATNTESQQETE